MMMYCEICERVSESACRECELRNENGVLREQLAEKDRMIETLMREPRIDREAHLRAALAAANNKSFWIGVADMWRNMAVRFAMKIKESGDSIERCAVLVESLPSLGLYRVGGGFHAPSYDDAWMVAARMIRSELGEKKNPPQPINPAVLAKLKAEFKP